MSVVLYRMSMSRHLTTEPHHAVDQQLQPPQQESTGRPLPNNSRPRRLPKVNNRDDDTTPRYGRRANDRAASGDQ